MAVGIRVPLGGSIAAWVIDDGDDEEFGQGARRAAMGAIERVKRSATMILDEGGDRGSSADRTDEGRFEAGWDDRRHELSSVKVWVGGVANTKTRVLANLGTSTFWSFRETLPNLLHRVGIETVTSSTDFAYQPTDLPLVR